MSSSQFQPLAVWNPNDRDSVFCRHRCEASAWAQKNFPDRARRVHRAEFYLVDTAFAVLYQFAEDAARQCVRGQGNWRAG